MSTTLTLPERRRLVGQFVPQQVDTGELVDPRPIDEDHAYVAATAATTQRCVIRC